MANKSYMTPQMEFFEIKLEERLLSSSAHVETMSIVEGGGDWDDLEDE